MKRPWILGAGVLLLSGVFPLLIQAEEETVRTEVYAYVEEKAPDLTSTKVFLMDGGQNQILLNRNGDERMFPASLTKMMTEILAIENLNDLNQTVTITEKMWEGLLEANASVAGFEVGSVATVRDLLYGCALPSGADAVNALALTVSPDIPSFVERMNQKAQEIGMTDTHFSNPTGLHAEDHYSTAHDLALLLQYCLQNETFKELLEAPSYTTTGGLVLESTVWSKIDGEIPGFVGGKTGYTLQAGRCLASAADFNGMRLILVTGGGEGEGPIRDAETLYGWYNEQYERKTILDEREPLIDIPVSDTWPQKNITVFNPYRVTMDLPKNAAVQRNPQIVETLYAPVEEGTRLGTFTITADEQVIYAAEIQAPVSIRRSTTAYLLRRMKDHPFLSIFCIGCMAALLWLLRQRRKRRKRRRMRRKRRAA